MGGKVKRKKNEKLYVTQKVKNKQGVHTNGC
jgi:hypothetical protein